MCILSPIYRGSFDDSYLLTFLKKENFTAARMRFIFVIRYAENKAIYLVSLIDNRMSAEGD